MRPEFKPSIARHLHLWCLLALMLSTGLANPGAAQPAGEERTAQFVFVIDDSLSMSHTTDGEEAADPNRLAVFAVRSLITMLDDLDEVSLVRLNGPLAGEPPLPLAPVARQRGEIAKMLANDAELPRYEGRQTPCRSALDAVGRLLEEAYRPGVSQVVLFLTDGRCNDGDLDGGGFLSRLRSRREGLFQLYLLRFRGREFSEALRQLAEASGGQAIEVGAEDPTALLEPFADALTRSQGYEAELLTPRKTHLAAHQGARRMRLLAVARGAGGELGFEVRDRLGKLLAGAGKSPETRVHRYGAGETYRYATFEYQPGAHEVEVRVTGAGERWKVVAVPEYRLFVRMDLHAGACSRGAERVNSLEAGQTLCAVITVVDDRGEVVSGDLAERGLMAGLRLSRPGARGQKPQETSANQQGRRAEFVFEQPHLEEGVWTLEPVVRLRLAGQKGARALPARTQTLQAVTVKIEVEPREVDFGALVPGQVAPGEVLRITGNFPPTRGRLEVVDREAMPPCVHFRLGEVGAGESLPILQDQPYSLALRVAPYCGPESFDRRFTTQLRILLDRADGKDLPGQVVTAHFGLKYRVEFPYELEVRLTAGESQRLEVPIRSNWTRLQDFAVAFGDPGGRWPEDGLTLEPLLAGEDHFRLNPADGDTAMLALEVEAGSCCAAGSYTTWLVLRPPDAGESGAAGAPVRPLQIPLRITVEDAGLWACRGSLILRGLFWLGLLLLGLYTLSMVRNSSFLSREHLAASLMPLCWDPYGVAVRHTRGQQEVAAMVRGGMGLGPRILAWLRANPLVFGLPGRRYRETVELLLQPERRADRSRLQPVAARDHFERLQTRPEDGLGRLFVRALGGRAHFFYAVPRGGTRIGRLVPEHLAAQTLFDAEDGDEADGKARVLRLKKRQRLIHPISEHEREEGRAAGWQLG